MIRLLDKNPATRLGNKGAGEIKNHPWFEKIKWDALKGKTIKSPFVPILQNEADTSNFDEEFTSCSVESYSERTNSNMMEEEVNQNKFVGFSFENE